MDYITAMQAKHDEIAKAAIRQQEREIITNYTAAGQITPQGMNSAITTLQAAAALQMQLRQALVIANAATAAAIRKQFTREEVEIIITPAVETGTAYIVTDEELKKQLLESIERRGY